MTPSFKVGAWQVVALVAILAALALGVLYLTPAEIRGDVIRASGGALGGLVAAVVAAVGAKTAHTVKQETRAQTEQLDAIGHKVNGDLTERLNTMRDETVSAVVGELEARGIIGGTAQGGY